MTTDFRGNGYSKNILICDCATEPTHGITTFLSYSLLPCGNGPLKPTMVYGCVLFLPDVVHVKCWCDRSLWNEFMAVFLQRIRSLPLAHSPTLGRYNREKSSYNRNSTKSLQVDLKTTQDTKETTKEFRWQNFIEKLFLILPSSSIHFSPIQTMIGLKFAIVQIRAWATYGYISWEENRRKNSQSAGDKLMWIEIWKAFALIFG